MMAAKSVTGPTKTENRKNKINNFFGIVDIFYVHKKKIDAS